MVISSFLCHSAITYLRLHYSLMKCYSQLHAPQHGALSQLFCKLSSKRGRIVVFIFLLNLFKLLLCLVSVRNSPSQAGANGFTKLARGLTIWLSVLSVVWVYVLSEIKQRKFQSDQPEQWWHVWWGYLDCWELISTV